MKIIFIDRNVDMVKAWDGLRPTGVQLIHGSILELKCDAIVSPANSFGFMDGGLDWAITKKFGWCVQKKVQERIVEDFNGELLVGQSLIVPTGDLSIPHVISSPTMRIPMRLNSNSVNPFLSTRSSIRIAQKNGFKSIAIPGMATGVGGLNKDVVARQMISALSDDVFPESWRDAQIKHQKLYTDKIRDLQFED